MDCLLDEFACSIRLIADVMEKITQIETLKATAASERRHGDMDGFLKQEQVLILKLRGLDRQRLTLAEALGWKGLTCQEILSKATDSQREQLEPLFMELKAQFRYLQSARESAERIIKLRLTELQRFFHEQNPYGDEEESMFSSPSSFHDRYV